MPLIERSAGNIWYFALAWSSDILITGWDQVPMTLAPTLTVPGFPSFFLRLRLWPLAVEKDMLPFGLSHVTSAHTVVGMIFTVGKILF